MAEYVLSDHDYGWAEPGRRRHAPAAENRWTAGRLAILVMAIVAVILVAVLAGVPLTEIARVELVHPGVVPVEELLAWAGLPAGSNWFGVDEVIVARAIAAHPRIAAVRVIKRFPNLLAFDVTERTPIAIVYARDGAGRLMAHCVDAEGVVFASAAEFPASGQLPVISGIEIRGLRYGMHLGGAFPALLSSMAEVSRTNPGLLDVVSEIRMVAREGAPVEAILYPANYRLPVRVKPVLNADLLKSMMLVLDVVETGGLAPAIRELDLRSETFVYIKKEAVSG